MIKKRYFFTVQTVSEKPDESLFWFGKADMSDNLKPIKIKAKSLSDAWSKLEKLESPKC